MHNTPQTSQVDSWKCLKKNWLNGLHKLWVGEITDAGYSAWNKLLLLSSPIIQLYFWVSRKSENRIPIEISTWLLGEADYFEFCKNLTLPSIWGSCYILQILFFSPSEGTSVPNGRFIQPWLVKPIFIDGFSELT